jgi:acetyltransferase-like isoleucine patch superfamily enzyme
MNRIKRLIHNRIEAIANAVVDDRLLIEITQLRNLANSKVKQDGLEKYLGDFINETIRVWGDEEKLHLDSTAQLANTLFNTSSGEVWIDEYSFTGHNVSIITGTHNGETFLQDRQAHFPTTGGDIRIGRGVWMGSNAVILGPSTIGDHAIIGAGCVVTSGSEIPRGAVVVGVPGRVIRILDNLPD